MLAIVLAVARPAFAQADAGSVLLADVGAGFVAVSDTPRTLGAVERQFERPGGSLSITAIPIQDGARPETLMRLVTEMNSGFDQVPEPSLGLAAWLVERGTTLGDAPVGWLFAASPTWMFSVLVAADGNGPVDFDPIDLARSTMRRQLERAGGLLAADSAQQSPNIEALIARLPEDAAGLRQVGTVDAGQEPIDVNFNPKVVRFLNEQSTGVVRLWSNDTLAAAVSLTEYPFDLFAAAALGAVTSLSDIRLERRGGEAADVVWFTGTGAPRRRGWRGIPPWQVLHVGAGHRLANLFVLRPRPRGCLVGR